MKCQLALSGHFQEQGQMSALVDSMARKVFMRGVCVFMNSLFFPLVQEDFSAMQLCFAHLSHKRAKELLLKDMRPVLMQMKESGISFSPLHLVSQQEYSCPFCHHTSL